jgi:small subunit ribosomal protein S20
VANTSSAQKAMRQAVRRAARNQAARSAVRTYVKKASEAVVNTAEDAAEVVRRAVSALDKAAQKGIVHRNAAARRKSRLMSRLHALSVAPAPAATLEPKAPVRRGAAAKGATGDKKPAARKPATSTRRTTRSKE